jgi:hypothetical protein
MNYIVDKNGKELNGKSNHKKRSWIYVNWQGIQNAQKQELFLTTRIDNDTYIVVMTDGDEAILEKDRTGKDGKLKICKDKYMKVDCKNRLLEKKKYRRASGDGE